MTDFLPKDYKLPTSDSGYMKLLKGDNKFRILSSPILGYVAWLDVGDSRKPKRFDMGSDISPKYAEGLKHFWAMIVWNYDVQQVQILELRQKTILKAINQYIRDEDWGNPKEYDLNVMRTGDGMETEYQVIAKPAKKLDEAIQGKYENMSINLKKLYATEEEPYGGNPFEAHENVKKKVNSDEDVIDPDSLPF